MTDDLAMDAISDFCQEDAAAVLAVLAGNDMIVRYRLSDADPGSSDSCFRWNDLLEQIDASVTRIILWKIHLGLLT